MAKRLLTVAVFGGEDGDDLLSVDVETHLVDLLVWWIKTAASDFDLTTGKIQEYGKGDDQAREEEGSADLRLVGENIAELIGLQSVDSALKQEIGAWFYLQGKAARCVANYKQGKKAKEDTLLDTTVYSLIMRRLQEHGNWP